MSGSAPTGPASAIERLIVQVDGAINARALYAPGHPNVARAAERLLSALAEACREGKRDAIRLLAVGDDIVVDDRPIPRAGLYHEQFVRLLTRAGIEHITLARGLEMAECLALLEPLAQGRAPEASPHVRVGRVEVRESGGHEPPPEKLDPESLDAAREAFTAFRGDRAGGLRRLEDVVAGLVEAMARATREVLPLAPLKDHDEYTFVHSINVSLLTLEQARSFGFDGDRLHALGLAALLHDVGKLKVPLEVLNKRGKLEGDEWRMMQAHAELGARHLCGIEGSHPLAILVAFEHHLRYDGRPAYPVLSRPRRPTC